MPAEPRGRLGVIGGSTFLDGVDLPGARLELIDTERGAVALHLHDRFAFLRRHGEDRYRPPHRISHHAHALAFEALGIDQVVGFASTGSLSERLPPGTIVVPDDYLSRHAPPTFAGDEFLHIVPALDARLRRLLLETVAGAPDAPPPVDGGVYAETRGPRFETPAEVRSLARDADLVGMTAASEATLLQELGIGYAVVCVVDNWANGLGPEPLTLDAFRTRQAENAAAVRAILTHLLQLWTSTP